ncbi:YafY family protein [Afifella sp. IM 167]|uniref:helix-turn-helix transcriptional regulator n=1 Tax=Afifella sp. IM 167 TaxID=2033586 RepID=UPI001CC936A8|nr:YafY family protein [Afifella sp. IM 167]MBZ8135372.1 DNA-binding transcriptional regulator [Afifella sp. IM 167]
MRRADRLFQIVQQLRGGRLVTARRLAEKLEVSERTIYRDMADLIGTGVPIEGEAGVGYLMRSGFDLPPLMFTREELAALMLGARFVKAWTGADLALAAEEALVKIEAVLPEKERRELAGTGLFAMAPGLGGEVRETFDRLDRCIRERLRVHVVYEALGGESSARDLRPLGLYHWGKVWTLAAWCEMRGDFRNFRVDRITRLEECGDAFREEPGKTLRDFLRRMAEEHGSPPRHSRP